MTEFPQPSDVPQVVMKTGTFSGLDVLKIGTIEPMATVELDDGHIGEVIEVMPRKFTWRGFSPVKVLVQYEDGGQQSLVSQDDIAMVLKQATSGS
jgi:hypothetical protein